MVGAGTSRGKAIRRDWHGSDLFAGMVIEISKGDLGLSVCRSSLARWSSWAF